MGANRVSEAVHAKASHPVWAVSHPGTLAASARPTGLVDLYTLPNAHRPPTKPLRLPQAIGNPTALSLRPASCPPTHPLAVTGTHTGHVLLDDVVIATLGNTPVLATYYAVDFIVAAGGLNNEVVVLNPSTRTVVKLFSLAAHHLSPITRCIALGHANTVLFCSQTLTTVDITTGSVLHSYMGHQTPVSAIATLPSHAITACDDTILSIWHTATDGIDGDSGDADTNPKRRRTSSGIDRAAASLVVPQPGVNMLCAFASGHGDRGGSRVDKDSNIYFVAAMQQTGDVAVWNSLSLPRRARRNASKVPIPPSFLVRAGGDHVFMAAFSKKGLLTILHGNTLKPSAYTLDISHMDDGASVSLPSLSANVIMRDDSDTAAYDKAKMVTATARMQVSNAAALEGTIVPKMKNKKGKPNGMMKAPQNEVMDSVLTDVEGKAVRSRLRDAKAGIDDDDDDQVQGNDESAEPSIQEKLEGLGIAMPQADAGTQSKDGKPSLVEATRLDSRVSVLLQAVRSRDAPMLDACVNGKLSPAIVFGTVRHIPSSVAANELLSLLVERLRVYPRRVETLAVWIRAILMEHASAIVAQRRNEAVGALVAICGARTRSLDVLTRLQGRLELVIGQAERIRRMGAQLNERAEPLMEYEEDEEDESESCSESSGEEDDEEQREDQDVEKGDAENNGESEDNRSKDSEGDDESEEESDSVDEGAKTIQRGLRVANGVPGKANKDMKMNGKMDVSDGESESESDDNAESEDD